MASPYQYRPDPQNSASYKNNDNPPPKSYGPEFAAENSRNLDRISRQEALEKANSDCLTKSLWIGVVFCGIIWGLLIYYNFF